MDKKLGVIVPFRNRYEQIGIFMERIQEYLYEKGIPFELIIVKQDDAKLFNRGMLLNIGFKEALKLECDYVVFHDIDMLPIDVDYSYSDHPVHLATNFKDKKRELFDTYFGGVTLFPINEFRRINGYSNKYWGWGYEDDDLLLRCVKKNIEFKKISKKGKAK
jgi:predicted glycosyltransferase involved in capsule biosynthesis